MEKSSSTLDAAEIFMERFPIIGLEIGAWECKEMPQEAPPPIHPGKEDLFYFYGLCPKVYFQLEDWLKEDKQLVFLEDDPGIIASFLKTEEALRILSNPKVHIELIGDLDELAKKFPVKRVEVAGFQSKKKLRTLRLQLLKKTALAHALHVDRLHGYQPFYNFVQNLRQLPHSFYVNGLKRAFLNTPAIVCGAGPSLGHDLEVLRNLEDKALIIAGGSTLAALSSKGIMPHFGMAVDPNLEEYRRMKNSFAFEVPLLYSTRVHPGIFRCSNGPFGYMRSGIGGLLELWVEEELGLKEDSFIGEFLSPETISVTGICIAFAEFLGCNPILLNGIDMAYTGGARYAAGVDGGAKVAFDVIDQEKTAADRIVRKKGVYSAVRWIIESESISHFAKKHKKVRFINTTTGGIGVKGIDSMPIQEAIKGFRKRKLREEVFEAINGSSMPFHTREKVNALLEELRQSLARVVYFLRILSGETKGSQALAEIELDEEIARLYLFYDIRQVIKPGPEFWQNWLKLALKYEIGL